MVELSPMQQRLAEQLERNRAAKAAEEPPRQFGFRFITYYEDGSEREFSSIQAQNNDWMHRFDGAGKTYQYPGPQVEFHHLASADPHPAVPEGAYRALAHLLDQEEAHVGAQQEAGRSDPDW